MKNQSNTPDPGEHTGGAERNVFRMKWLLSRARRRIARLLPEDRARVAQSLTDRIDATLCEPILSSPYPGTFHYNVGRDIRVCFVVHEGFGLVVYVGNHYECDRAVYHSKWRLRGRFIPVEGFIIMHNEKKETANNNGAVFASSPTTPTKPSATDFDAWIQMLPGVVDATFAAPLRQADAARRSAIEDVTAKANENSTELAALTTRVETLSQRFDSHSHESSSKFATLDKAVSEADQRTHSFRHECQTTVGGLKGEVKAVKCDLSDLSRGTSTTFESVHGALNRTNQSHDALERAVYPALSDFRNFESATNGFIAETKTKLAVLEAQDPAGPLITRLEQHEKRLDGQDEAAVSTRADFARSLERTASLCADVAQLKENVPELKLRMSELRSSLSSLLDRFESEARARIDRENRSFVASMSRWIERIRTGTGTGWVRTRSARRS